MKRNSKKRTKKKVKKRNVGIPEYTNGENLLKNPCKLCGGHVIYTDNAILYTESKGLGVCYYCEDCHASVLCNKQRKEILEDGTEVYSPLGILGTKETRQLRIRCHQILDSTWRLNRAMKRSTAYRKLAIAMGIPYESCHFSWMNTEQLAYALEILTLTQWTKITFD